MVTTTTTICEVLERYPATKTTSTVVGTVKGLTYHQLVYRACGRLLGADRICFLKVVRVDGAWRCKTCQSLTPTQVTWRFCGRVEVADATGSLWATCWEEEAVKLLGVSSQQLGEALERDPAAYQAILAAARLKTFKVKILAQPESYDGEARVQFKVGVIM